MREIQAGYAERFKQMEPPRRIEEAEADHARLLEELCVSEQDEKELRLLSRINMKN